MRNLTIYETGKWGVGYDFEAPEYLVYGGEDGEAYDALIRVHRMTLFHDEELAGHIQALALDLYYDSVEWLLDEGRDHYNIGLPSLNEYEKCYLQISVDSLEFNPNVSRRVALDWAVEWREEHKDETYKDQRREHLLAELAKLDEE